MAIRLKAVKLKMPGDVKGDRYVGRAVSSGEADLAELTTRIEQMSTVHGTDIRAVLYALVSVAKSLLKEGKIVRLGELGSLRISVSSEIVDSADQVNGKSVKKAKVLFTQGDHFKDLLKVLEYKKY